MHMIDVMAKLKDIAESGYDNEDIQRGITAAATQNYEVSEDAVKEGVSKSKMIDDAESMSMEDFVEEYSAQGMSEAEAKQAYKEIMGEGIGEAAVSEDAVEEVHEDAVDDHSLEDMLKLAGRSGVMGMNQNNLLSESVYHELDEDDLDEGDLVPFTSPADAERKAKDTKFGHNIGEAAVEETVAVPVQALEELMRLAGYENYEAQIDEYENAPEPEYMDAEEQLIGLSGGLNGPKKAYAAAAGGDNAMAQEPTEVDESLEESFYSEYSKMVEDLRSEDD